METTIETTEVIEKNVLERVWQRIADVISPKQDSAFTVIKGADGRYYWHARHSNNFEDREKEILSEKSHEDYVRRVDMGLVPPPELWSWHTDGTRQGIAEKVFYDNHIMNAVGVFDATPEGETARKFYERNAGKIELSHGFTFPKWALKDGIYEVYNTFEISTLPIGAAANPYTTFEEINAMALSDEKRQWLESTLGKDRTDKLLADNEKMGKAVEELGKSYKDFADVPPATETVAPVEGQAPATEEKPKLDAVTFAQLLSDMLEGQAHIVEVVGGQGKAIKSIQETNATKEAANAAALKSVKDENVALKTELASLRAELSLTPRRASEAAETLVTEAAAKTIIGEAASENDPFFS